MTQPPLLRLFKGGFAAFLEFGAFTPPCQGGEYASCSRPSPFSFWRGKHSLEEKAVIPAFARRGGCAIKKNAPVPLKAQTGWLVISRSLLIDAREALPY